MISSAEEFVELRTSEVEAEYVRAATDDIPESVCLDVIARYPTMRRWIAHNKTVPQSILRILADDPDHDVRFFVAMKRKTDPEILRKLAQDTYESIREQIALNPKTPHSVLKLLVNDQVERIAETALQRIAER
jgi:hypothetical protein